MISAISGIFDFLDFPEFSVIFLLRKWGKPYDLLALRKNQCELEGMSVINVRAMPWSTGNKDIQPGENVPWDRSPSALPPAVLGVCTSPGDPGTGDGVVCIPT